VEVFLIRGKRSREDGEEWFGGVGMREMIRVVWAVRRVGWSEIIYV